MAVTSNTLIGASRGSIGNATMTRVKGQNILKEKIQQASGPLSDPRKLQRSRVTVLMPIARALKQAIDLGYAKLAKGTIGTTAISAVNVTTASADAVITWPAAAAPVGSSVDDLPVIGIYNITTGVFSTAVGTASEKRSTGTWTVIMSGVWTTADVLATYLFFKNPSTGQVSDSVYSADAS